MRIREIIRKIPDAECTHGGAYIDLITGKPRQFDFRCSLRRDQRGLHLAVECKNLAVTAPVVICGINRSPDETFHEIIEARWGLFQEPGEVMDGHYSKTRRVVDSTVYQRGDFVGKSVVRLKPIKDGKGNQSYGSAPDSDVYEGWTLALSSAYDLCKEATEQALKSSVRHFFSITIPVVVVPDESLWVLKYDEDGVVRSEPCRSDHCPFYVDRGLAVTGWEADQRFCLSHIHFCTVSGFKSWLTSIEAEEDLWNRWFPPASLTQWKT